MKLTRNDIGMLYCYIIFIVNRSIRKENGKNDAPLTPESIAVHGGKKFKAKHYSRGIQRNSEK